MKHYKINKKVFETPEEARGFAKDLQAHGAFGGWTITKEPVTHRYLGDLRTEPYNELDWYITPYEQNKYCAECERECSRECDIMKKAEERYYKEDGNGKE